MNPLLASGCGDSDSQLGSPNNLLTQGTVTTSKNIYGDYCIDGINLMEYYCYTGNISGTNPAQASKVNCIERGYDGCENGACVNEYLKKIDYNKSRVVNYTKIKGNSYGYIEVFCPKDKIIINGGCRIQGIGSDIALLESHLSFMTSWNGFSGWSCAGYNRNNDNAGIEVYGYCI